MLLRFQSFLTSRLSLQLSASVLQIMLHVRRAACGVNAMAQVVGYRLETLCRTAP